MKPARSFTGEVVYTLILLVAVVVIRFIADRPFFIESEYVYGFYRSLAAFYRFLWGWLPFSIGDLLYTSAGIWLIIKVVRLIRYLLRRRFTLPGLFLGAFRYFRLAIWIYLIFNISWGLNYNRPGIAWQLGLDVKNEPVDKLRMLTSILLEETNKYSTNPEWKKEYPVSAIFAQATRAFDQIQQQHAFLNYRPVSVKKSLFGVIGNYVGYSGYFNPFTGEAQINHYVPAAVLPFVTCHEIAHQLGYAKENEANFVGFLTAKNSSDTAFRYSAFFEMFLYANSELYRFDTAAYRANLRALSPAAKADLVELRNFRLKYESPVDKLVSVFYDRYLKLNQQPSGEKSYSRVVMWLLAYYTKRGEI